MGYGPERTSSPTNDDWWLNHVRHPEVPDFGPMIVPVNLSYSVVSWDVLGKPINVEYKPELTYDDFTRVHMWCMQDNYLGQYLPPNSIKGIPVHTQLMECEAPVQNKVAQMTLNWTEEMNKYAY